MENPTESVPKKRKSVAEAWLAWLSLFFVWVILSGKFDAFHLGMGALTVLGLRWLHRGLEPLRAAGSPTLRVGRLIVYSVWLFKEMIMSALFVAKVILKTNHELEPELVHFEAEQPTVLNAVIFGHSITLTPGTITLDLEDNRYLVHALTKETARGVIDGSMSRRVAKLSTDAEVAKPRTLPEPIITNLWT